MVAHNERCIAPTSVDSDSHLFPLRQIPTKFCDAAVFPLLPQISVPSWRSHCLLSAGHIAGHWSERPTRGILRTRRRGVYRYLRSTEHMGKTMREIIMLAFPNPAHYLRLRPHLVVPHCNRVTAAVALYNMGWSFPEIAYRLRWQPDSVMHYIRESPYKVGKATGDALVGAFRLESKRPS